MLHIFIYEPVSVPIVNSIIDLIIWYSYRGCFSTKKYARMCNNNKLLISFQDTTT